MNEFGIVAHNKGLDMVDKAGVGGQKWISQKWLSNETNKQISLGITEYLIYRGEQTLSQDVIKCHENGKMYKKYHCFIIVIIQNSTQSICGSM